METKLKLESWDVAKGLYGTLENIADIVYACYNTLVQSMIDTNSDASVNWYNKEIYICLKKVHHVLDGGDFTLPTFKKIASHEDIICAFERIAQGHGLTCELLHALEALYTFSAIIWGLKCDQSESLKLHTLSEVVPFDCIIEKNNKCKWSQKINISLILYQQHQVKIPEFPDQCIHVLFQFRIYAAAFSQYQIRQYKESAEILHQYLKIIESRIDDVLPLNLSKMYNLLACCYANLGSLHAAIVYFRKAVQCSDNNLACHLKNITMLFSQLGKWDAAMQTVQILLESFECQRTERKIDHLLVFHSQHKMEILSLSNLSHWGFASDKNDINRALYLACSVTSRANCAQKAVKYYERLLINRKQMMSLQTRSHWHLPSREQIIAEKELASVEMCPKTDDLTDYYSIKTELIRLSQMLDKILENFVASSDENVLLDFVLVGKKLYHHVCYTNCNLKHFTSHIDHLSELASIEQLIEWNPKIYVAPLVEDIGATSLMSRVASTIAFLNAAQANFLLNKAIIMTFTDKKAEIFQLLQRVLKLAPTDIEIRWKLILLLWKLGHKSEACKSWLNTRALDYRMTAQEIKAQVEERSSKQVTESEKSLLQRDVAILKEVYRNRQNVHRHNHLQHP